MSRNSRNNQPHGPQAPNTGVPTRERPAAPPKRTCADILKDNVVEILTQQFLDNARGWTEADNLPVTDAAAMRDVTIPELWQDVTVSIRFSMSFEPRRRLNRPPQSIEDYYPLIHVTGSFKPAAPMAQPATDAQPAQQGQQ